MDLTSLFSTYHQRKRHIILIPLALILFALGWQSGRITSPYYASHPIVFEDRECQDNVSSGGSKEELQALREEGSAPNPKPAVAASVDKEEGQFVGSINSDLFHAIGCPSVGRIKKENQIWFASIEEAGESGYKPSKCTKEKLNLP
jgi:hypothetical protein